VVTLTCNHTNTSCSYKNDHGHGWKVEGSKVSMMVCDRNVQGHKEEECLCEGKGADNDVISTGCGTHICKGDPTGCWYPLSDW